MVRSSAHDGGSDALRALLFRRGLGILHRYDKPANFLLTDFGAPEVADFGIAHIAGGFETATGVVTGLHRSGGVRGRSAEQAATPSAPTPFSPLDRLAGWSLGHRNVQGVAWDDAGFGGRSASNE